MRSIPSSTHCCIREHSRWGTWGTPGLVGGLGSSLCRGITKGTQRATHHILCVLPLPGRPGLSSAVLRVSFLCKSLGRRGRIGVFVKEAGKKKKKGKKKKQKHKTQAQQWQAARTGAQRFPEHVKTFLQPGDQGSAGCKDTCVCTHHLTHRNKDSSPQHPTTLHMLSPNVQPGWSFPRATSPATASFCLPTVPGTISGDWQTGKPHGWTTRECFVLDLLLQPLPVSLCEGMGTGEEQILPGFTEMGALEEEQL